MREAEGDRSMTHPIKPIATATVVARQHVVLVKYNAMPDHQRGWFLPHDLLNLLEHPTDAAVRALREQLGIELGAAALALKDVESFKGRDGTWHMSFHHVARLPERVELQPSGDLAVAEWFALERLPARTEVSHHGWALDTIEKVTS
jgi:ADP-ribose pyrophosphatase YjhB (NUDIX family)